MSPLAGGRPRRRQRGAACALHKNLNWRIAGEIALTSAEPNVAKAEAHFEHGLAIARAQQAKSWELRAAMSLARLWRGSLSARSTSQERAPVSQAAAKEPAEAGEFTTIKPTIMAFVAKSKHGLGRVGTVLFFYFFCFHGHCRLSKVIWHHRRSTCGRSMWTRASLCLDRRRAQY